MNEARGPKRVQKEKPEGKRGICGLKSWWFDGMECGKERKMKTICRRQKRMKKGS